MSFLSILLVASAFYFAHARPDPQSWPEAFGAVPEYNDDGVVQDAPSVPEQSSVLIIDPQDYQHQLFGFMQDVNKAVDQYLTPLMTKLDVTKQDKLKSMDMNEFASYVNDVLLQMQEKPNENDKGDDQTTYPLDPNTPFIGDTQDEEETYNEQ